ncbi:MAG: sodium-dependent transporter [Chlamydiales bacterium]|nr:sodium-dependent transporter [Chlamydiales bacterium]
MTTPRTREHWSSRFGFLMAAIGSAVGLGILWKFPYTVGENGGGLFLISYFMCIALIGVPLFVAELVLGRRSQRAAVGAFDGNWRIAGWFGVAASFLIMSFYSVIAGWGISYVLMSLTGFYQGLSGQEVVAVFKHLARSGGISLFWHLVFTLLTMGIVFAGVRKGIEYWSKVMTRALLVLLLLLFAYSAIKLPGFGKAVHFVFVPDLSRFSFSSLMEAVGLAFFTMSLGQGIMISYGSYMKKDSDIPTMAGIVAGSIFVVAILAALTIFPVVFSFDLPPESGYGLVFETLPFLFAQLPGALVISTLFFVLFVFTALTSAIPLIEVVATNLMELKGWKRKKAVLLTGAGCFVVGIPSAYAASGAVFGNWERLFQMNFLETVNELVSVWVIPVAGLLTAIYVGWIMDRDGRLEEFCQGTRFKWLFAPWLIFVRWLVPIIMLLIISAKSGLIDFDGWIR